MGRLIITISVLGIVLLHILCIAASASIETKEWAIQNAASGDEPVSVRMKAGSLTECASLCSQQLGCTTFCYSAPSVTCYVRDCMTSNTVQRDLVDDLTNKDIRCSALGACPHDLGYQEVEGQCVKVHSQALSYSAARNKCQEEGAYLYLFKRRDRDRLVIQHAVHGSSISTSLWVGADDIMTEGHFLWNDGCTLSSKGDLWKHGEPNNKANKENCVELQLSNDYLFNDRGCYYELSFVCQIF